MLCRLEHAQSTTLRAFYREKRPFACSRRAEFNLRRSIYLSASRIAEKTAKCEYIVREKSMHMGSIHMRRLDARNRREAGRGSVFFIIIGPRKCKVVAKECTEQGSKTWNCYHNVYSRLSSVDVPPYLVLQFSRQLASIPLSFSL